MNDAPALKAASVGIAVSGATPAAQGAADIVLTQACSSLASHLQFGQNPGAILAPAEC